VHRDSRKQTIPIIERRLPIGAECLPAGGAGFRVWAPEARRVALILRKSSGGDEIVAPLRNEGNGYFSRHEPHAGAGDRYWFALDEGRRLPDPASRFQPEGPTGPSLLIDPHTYEWHDRSWPGVRLAGQVIYELHIGTFTREGTWRAAAERLAHLRDTGITLLEIMPVHDFCGRYGWGYDSVNFFAPMRCYGMPDDFRAFVDHAHTLGLGVVLDVVYNHVGPHGDYFKSYSQHYFSQSNTTEWGQSFNFDGPQAKAVREFFSANAGYWVDEFHLDGLRFDATQNIYDESPTHILCEISAHARRVATRSIVLIAENEPQDSRRMRGHEAEAWGIDAMWNDDFHHAAVVALTGHNEAYYSDYRGRPQEFVAAAKYGFLYQGQYYGWQSQRRGHPTQGLPPAAFINFLENHDQIANLGRGQRLRELCHPGAYRAMTALLLLGPQTPLLFQGQEYGATTRFTFFADHEEPLASAVKKGRFEFLAQFPSMASVETQARLPDPGDPAVFEACRLDPAERERHRALYDLHRDLLRLRREDPVFRAQAADGLDGAVLSDEVFALRYAGADGGRLLLLNLGRDLHLSPVPEPLLAPPTDRVWELLWSSEHPRYDGLGGQALESAAGWFIPGHAAFVFRAA
jgi:maltooligosyltrehalose trehalohydrolase